MLHELYFNNETMMIWILYKEKVWLEKKRSRIYSFRCYYAVLEFIIVGRGHHHLKLCLINNFLTFQMMPIPSQKSSKFYFCFFSLWWESLALLPPLRRQSQERQQFEFVLYVPTEDMTDDFKFDNYSFHFLANLFTLFSNLRLFLL